MKEDTFRILFVCSGNSCRSPMAEGLMKVKVPEKYRERVEVHSAGTLGLFGHPATEYAVHAADELGANISKHRSQGISAQLLRDADVIFAMAREHKSYIERQFPEVRENVFLLKSFGQSIAEVAGENIDDPIGESLSFYRKCAGIIDSELNRILPRLTQLMREKVE
jgi:protein-tyrosine phosphatase